MLEVLITYLQGQIAQLFPDVKIYGLCQKLNFDEGKKYPAEYCSSGESKAVNFDYDKGLVYFRQVGQMTIEEIEEESTTGCDLYQRRVYPLRVVAYIPKKYYKTDNGYIDNKITENLIKILNINQSKALRTALKIDMIETIGFRANSNAEEVWFEETDNLRDESNSQYVLCFVDFTLEVGAELSCFDYWSCNDAKITIDSDTITAMVVCADQLCKAGEDPITYDAVKELIDGSGGGGLTCEQVMQCQGILDIEQDIADLAVDLTAHETNTSNPHSVTKSQVGLGNVDNTSDANKPVSTAQAAADAATLSSANTYADGKVADAINDGITTIAPSQNAVFDALATKENTANKDASGGYVGLSGWSIKFRNLANTFTSLLQNAATAVRTYVFPDKDGTVAMLDDLVGVYITARNNTGSTISKGKVVYVSGAVGQNPTIALARANAETTSFSIGVSAFDIPNNTNVQNNVIIAGLVDDIDTSAFSDGDKVYLSSATAGELQNTAPSSPNFGALVGFCLYSHAVHGKLLIAPDDTVISQNTSLGTSRIVTPSENAVKTYADTKTTLAAVNAQKLSVFAATTSAELMTVISDETGVGTIVLGSDSGFGTYTGAIAWTGTTAPSGATAHQYRWVRNGNMVTLSVLLSYATAGTANTKVICDLPSGAPTPAKWSSTTALTDFMYMGSGGLSASKAETTGSGRNSGLAINTASTSAFDLIIQHASTNAKTAWITVQYYV